MWGKDLGVRFWKIEYKIATRDCEKFYLTQTTTMMTVNHNFQKALLTFVMNFEALIIPSPNFVGEGDILYWSTQTQK